MFEHSCVSACWNILCTIVRNTFPVLVHSNGQIIFSQFIFVFLVLFVVNWTFEPTPGCINCYTFAVLFLFFLCLVESTITLLSFVFCVASICIHIYSELL